MDDHNQDQVEQVNMTFDEGLQFYHDFETDKIPEQQPYEPWYKHFPADTWVNLKGAETPTRLLRWEDCEERLWLRFQILRKFFYPTGQEPLRIFNKHVAHQRAGKLVHEWPFSSKHGRQVHQEYLVERPVEEMLSGLIQHCPDIAEDLDIADGIGFGSGTKFDADQVKLPDSRVFFGSAEAEVPNEAFLIFHQGAHLLSVDDFKRVLDCSPDLFQKVQSSCWTAEQEIVAKTLAELYDHMLHTNHRYACLTTVEALIFIQLRFVRHGDSQQYDTEMLCHVVEPKRQVSRSGQLFHSTIGQMASFCLLTLC